MTIIETQDTVSLVVIPEEKLMKDLLPIIQEWTSEGLLGRFLLISPVQIIESPDEPLRIMASIFFENAGEIEVQEVDAFEQLAQHEFSIVRLIALRVLEKNTAIDKSQNIQLSKVANFVEKILPMANSRMNETQLVTRFLRMNLVVAPSETHKINHESAFAGTWDMNIVASPEDRSTPWAADALVRNDPKFLRFVLMHLASTGGLWNGLGTSPFELVEREKARDGGKWISRVFVNAILTDGLSKRVAAGVLDEIANASKDIYDARIAINVPGTQIIEPELVDDYVEWMVGQVFLLEDSTLSFNRPLEIDAPAKLRWMELEQIKNFLSFSWDKIKVIPWWIYVWFRRLIGRKLNQVFQSAEGLAEVGIDQNDPMDLRDRNLILKLASIKTRAAEAKRAMAATENQKAGRGTQRLWSSIRRLVFGMLDGSDLTEFGLVETDGRVPVFANTGQIITDPGDTFKIPNNIKSDVKVTEVTWKNIDQVEPILSSLKKELDILQIKRNEIQEAVTSADLEIENLESELRGF